MSLEINKKNERKISVLSLSLYVRAHGKIHLFYPVVTQIKYTNWEVEG